MELLLSVQGKDPVADLEELFDWLSRDVELRGAVRFAPAEPEPGELGAASDVLIAAVGAGGASSVLAASLKNFLSVPRRSDIHIAVTRPDGQPFEFDGRREQGSRMAARRDRVSACRRFDAVISSLHDRSPSRDHNTPRPSLSRKDRYIGAGRAPGGHRAGHRSSCVVLLAPRRAGRGRRVERNVQDHRRPLHRTRSAHIVEQHQWTSQK